MSSTQKLVSRAARQVMANPGGLSWNDMIAQGWVGAGVEPDAGGLGGTLTEAVAIAQAAGSTGVCAPVVEALLGPLVAASAPAGHPLVERLSNGTDRAVVVPQCLCSGEDKVVPVPWGAEATTLLVIVGSSSGRRLAVIGMDELRVEPGRDIAGIPVAFVRLGADVVTDHQLDGDLDMREIRIATAVLTAARLLGAMEAIHSMTIEYADQRRQFGVPLSSFQALAHSIARQAGAVELSRAAVSVGASAAEIGDELRSTAARVTAGSVAGEVARIAHQVHGAVGVTREHDLHRFTIPLRAWRDQYGTKRAWETRLGTLVAGHTDVLWDGLAPEAVE